MSRRKSSVKRTLIPDPKFGDRIIARFVGSLMKDGKKSVAYGIIYQAMDQISEKMKDDPLKIVKTAMENVRPVVETKSRRVGGANYQVPVEVRSSRGEALSIRWILKSAQDRPGKTMVERLSNEIMDAYQKRGAAIKKKEDVHKMAEANKAFAHFRW